MLGHLPGWGLGGCTDHRLVLTLQARSAREWRGEALKGQGLQQPSDDVEHPVTVTTRREDGSDHGAQSKE